jgi:hypothetical protein
MIGDSMLIRFLVIILFASGGMAYDCGKWPEAIVRLLNEQGQVLRVHSGIYSETLMTLDSNWVCNELDDRNKDSYERWSCGNPCPGYFEVRINVPRYYEQIEVIRFSCQIPDTYDIVLTKIPPGFIEGQVVDEKGIWGTGLQVSVHDMETVKLMPKDSGQFRFELPPGEYKVHVLHSPPVYSCFPTGDSRIWYDSAEVVVEANQTLTLDFIIEPPPRVAITGFVRDRDDKALAGIPVRCRTDSQLVFTDSQGFYRLENQLERQEHCVKVGEDTEYKPVSKLVGKPHNASESSDFNWDVRLYREGMESQVVVTSLPAPSASGGTGKIAGRVVDAFGDGVIGANILVVEIQKGTNIQNLDGNYVILGVAPGKYTVKATSIGHATAIIESLAVYGRATTGVDFILTEVPYDSCW